MNYRIIWLIKKEAIITDLPDYIKRIDSDSFLAAFYLYTAKYWIDDSRKTIKYAKGKTILFSNMARYAFKKN
ncbi:hypothetical protein AAHH62_01045 [Enterococcus faecium]